LDSSLLVTPEARSIVPRLLLQQQQCGLVFFMPQYYVTVKKYILSFSNDLSSVPLSLIQMFLNSGCSTDEVYQYSVAIKSLWAADNVLKAAVCILRCLS